MISKKILMGLVLIFFLFNTSFAKPFYVKDNRAVSLYAVKIEKDYISELTDIKLRFLSSNCIEVNVTGKDRLKKMKKDKDKLSFVEFYKKWKKYIDKWEKKKSLSNIIYDLSAIDRAGVISYSDGVKFSKNNINLLGDSFVVCFDKFEKGKYVKFGFGTTTITIIDSNLSVEVDPYEDVCLAHCEHEMVIVNKNPFPINITSENFEIYKNPNMRNVKIKTLVNKSITREVGIFEPRYIITDELLDDCIKVNDTHYNCTEYVEVGKKNITYYNLEFVPLLFRTIEPFSNTTFKIEYDKDPQDVKGEWNLTFRFNDSYIYIDPWYYSGWEYRRQIDVTDNSGSTLINYTVPINITYDSDMQPDFSDIRFTFYNETDGTEKEIPYWIENYSSSAWAFVWVKIPEIPANDNATIYLYYGSTTPVSSASNGFDTFLFFDNFDNQDITTPVNWQIVDGDTSTIYETSDGYLYLGGATQTSRVDGYVDIDLSRDGTTFEWRYRVNIPSTAYECSIFAGLWGASNGYEWRSRWVNRNIRGYYIDKYTSSVTRHKIIDPPPSGEHTYAIRRYSDSTWEVYMDGDFEGSFTDTFVPSDFTFVRLSGSYKDVYFDWYLIRKFVNNEPTTTIFEEETIQATQDVLKPRINDFYIVNSSIEINGSASFIANITDDSGVDTVIFEFKTPYGQFNVTAYQDSTSPELYIADFNSTGGNNGISKTNQTGEYEWWSIYANDTSGNLKLLHPGLKLYVVEVREQPITITNNVGYNLTNYTVLIKFDTQSQILDGNMSSDCRDIRFYDSDGSTELNYWIESGCNTTSTRIWVKIPFLQENSNKVIYMEYGNLSLQPASNGFKTFLEFEDFDNPVLEEQNLTGFGSSLELVRYEDQTPVLYLNKSWKYTALIGVDDDEEPEEGMCIAYSNDLVNWYIHKCGIKATNGLGLRWVGTVLYFPDGLDGYKFWIYGSGDNLGGSGQAVWLLRGNSLDNLTDYHKIWYPGQKTGWDSSCHVSVRVIKRGNVWHAWYHANDDVHNQIGYANSTDGFVTSWTKNPDPVIPYNWTTDWDDDENVMFPTVYWNGTHYIMWYRGTQNPVGVSEHMLNGTIYWAVSENGISWQFMGILFRQDLNNHYEAWGIGPVGILDYDDGLFTYTTNNGTARIVRWSHVIELKWNHTTNNFTKTTNVMLTIPFFARMNNKINATATLQRSNLYSSGLVNITEFGFVNITEGGIIRTLNTYDTNFSVTYHGVENAGYWMAVYWSYIDTDNYYRWIVGEHGVGTDDYLFGKRVGGTNTNWVLWESLGYDTRVWQTYTVSSYNYNHTLYVNDNYINSQVDSELPSGKIEFTNYYLSGGNSFIDYLFVRKYVYPEPNVTFGVISPYQSYEINTFDSIVLLESKENIGTFERIFSNYITISEIYSKLNLFNKRLNDTVTYYEIIEKLAEFEITKQDAIALDEYLRRIGMFKKSIFDNITYGEIIQLLKSLLKEKTVYDQITINEFLSKLGFFNKNIAEQISPYEKLSKLAEMKREGYDTITLSYILYKIGIFDEKVIDIMIYNEMLKTNGIFSRDLSDTITYNELLKRIGFWKKSSSENITVGELLFKIGVLKRINKDIINTYDVLYKYGIFDRGFYDTITYDELAKILGIYSRNLNEEITIGELLEKLSILRIKVIDVFDFATFSSKVSLQAQLSKVLFSPITIVGNIFFGYPMQILEQSIAYLFPSGFKLSEYQINLVIEPKQIIITDMEPNIKITKTIKLINKENKKVAILIAGLPKVSKRLILLQPGEEKELTILFNSPEECKSEKYQLALFINKEGIYVRKNIDIYVSSRCTGKLIGEINRIKSELSNYEKIIIISIAVILTIIVIYREKIIKELKSFLPVNRESE